MLITIAIAILAITAAAIACILLYRLPPDDPGPVWPQCSGSRQTLTGTPRGGLAPRPRRMWHINIQELAERMRDKIDA